MQSENICFFAWCQIGEPFDPSVHAILPNGRRRWDDRPLSVVLRHSEWGRRTASVDFGASLGGELLDGREACHISALINGQVRHLLHAPVTKSANGVRSQRTVAEFEAKHPNDIQLQADLLATVARNPVLYIPEIEEAKDALDAETILKATTVQMEFDRYGVPSLCSIFGDPNRVKILPPSRIELASIAPTFEAAPPRAAVIDLVLEHTQRRAGPVDASMTIQREIDRIGDHYGLPEFGANFTHTPDFLKQWPKPGDTVGESHVVTYAYLGPVDGPGTVPKTSSSRPRLSGYEPTEDVVGIPKNKADYGADETRVEKDSTGFTMPVLGLYGIQAKARRERVRIIVPFRGQELVPFNAEPTYIEIVASGLDEDKTVEEWKQDGEYPAGSRAKAGGMVFQSTVDQIGRNGLINDLNDFDPFSATLGNNLWEPVEFTNAPIPYPDTESAALSGFGRRAIQYAVRRCVATLGYASRAVTEPARIAIEDAWDLDTCTTVRLEGEIFKGSRIEGKVADLQLAFDAEGGTAATISLAVSIGSGETDDEWDDEDDGEEGQEPGGEYPVATEGGKWDVVRYRAPFVAAEPMASPDSLLTTKIDWLGCEQEWAIRHPGQNVWDPYHTLPRTVRYVRGVFNEEGKPIGPQEWMEKYSTSIALGVRSGDEADAKEILVPVAVTYGWRGPKQIQL